VALQAFLIASGNLSFLNWLTIVPALACFDDTAFVRLMPSRLRPGMLARFETLAVAPRHATVTYVLAVIVGLLSVAPVMNLASCDQSMNDSFDPFNLVNTYGAFGTVDRVRDEVILEGTRDAEPDAGARWSEYELPCMPGDTRRRPCLVAPYHYRLDWQMWFVRGRQQPIQREPWLVHLVWQLLEGDPAPKPLLARDPFPDSPPRWIRAAVWRYRFTPSRADGSWWTRERVEEYLDPVSLEDPDLRDYVRAYGWLRDE
jgi:hypothetical protein